MWSDRYFQCKTLIALESATKGALEAVSPPNPVNLTKKYDSVICCQTVSAQLLHDKDEITTQAL